MKLKYSQVAVLYNNAEELDKFLAVLSEDGEVLDCLHNRLAVQYGNEVIDYITCRCTPDLVRKTYCGTEFKYFLVAGETMYDGEALQYVACRLRYVEDRVTREEILTRWK